MEIKINKTDYLLNFGILFVKKLNALHFIDRDGIQVGVGLASVIPGVLQKDVSVLSEVIYLGLWANKNRPTQAQVDEYLENPETDIDLLFKDVFIKLQESNVTKAAMRNFEKTLPEEYKVTA